MKDLYAVIGKPIAHSKSPQIHLSFARSCGQNIDYTKIEGVVGDFAGQVDALRRAGGRGLNITAPFKLDAYAYASQLSERAQFAGAVNAMRFERGVVEGENFDGVGLVRDIVVNLGVPLAGARVLVLGAGGAARGTLPYFLAERPASLVVVNRTIDKARALAAQFATRGPIAAADYDALGGAPFDIVINATSASMTHELPPIPASAFQGCRLAYELAYGKGLTPFLARAREGQVHRLVDGVGMLVEQAAEAFTWWRGVRPETADVIKAITVPIE